MLTGLPSEEIIISIGLKHWIKYIYLVQFLTFEKRAYWTLFQHQNRHESRILGTHSGCYRVKWILVAFMIFHNLWSSTLLLFLSSSARRRSNLCNWMNGIIIYAIRYFGLLSPKVTCNSRCLVVSSNYNLVAAWYYL